MIGVKNKEIVEKGNNQPKVVLIDADSMLYFSGYGSENDQDFSETKLSEKIYDILNIIEKSYEIKEFKIFVGGKNNFRYQIFPDYKKNRPQKPEIVKVLSRYLVDNFGAIESHNAESDDYVYTYSEINKDNCIVCSVDKDMLQIPGIHYDYQKNKWHYITEDEANYNLGIQMIMGDACDGISGLKGYGPVKAKKLITLGMTKFQIMKVILGEYQKNCLKPKEEIKLNYKLLKLRYMEEVIKNN